MAVGPEDGATPEILSDLVAFEAAEDPDVEQPRSDPEEPTVDSNPFDIEYGPEGLLAVDAGGNDILAVDPATGATSVVAVVPFGETEAPPFLGAPPGTMIPYQSVPTGISLGERGTLVSQLTGFPFPVGGANILELTDDGVEVAEGGFTNVIDIAQAPDGTLYVLEFSTVGLLNEPETAPPTSRLVQVRTDGTRKVLLQDELFVPAGVVVGPDGMVYVTNGSQVAGEGTVIRVDPSVAADEATASACDPTLVLGAEFADVGGDVHRESIDCLAWWGIVRGVGDNDFAPSQSVTRAQVATIVVGVLEATGMEVELGEDAFDDDDGDVHEDSINTLAGLGVIGGTGARTFSPNDPVSRGQLATILAAAYEVAADEALPAGDDAFDDDDGTEHEDAINAVAAAGWITGKGEGTFAPGDPTTRAQLASLVARMLSTLVDEGLAEVPAAG